MVTKVGQGLLERHGRKNHIINGNFDFWQRGTSFVDVAEYSADRWNINFTGGTNDTNRQAFTLGQTDVPNEPTYFIRNIITTSSATNSQHLLNYHVESVRTLASKTATISFWAKADATKNMAFEVLQFFGSGGTPSATVDQIGVTTIPLTTSWQKFIVTFNLPSISGKTLGTDKNDRVQLRFFFEAGSDFNANTNSLGTQSGTFDMAQVQLEEGTVATEFEFRSPQEELSLCQRYYEKTYDIDVDPGTTSDIGALNEQSPIAKRSPVQRPDFDISSTHN